MCRNIKTLFNFDPPVTAQEIEAASLQFVRKITGFNKPSQANEAAFLIAIDEITASANRLLRSLETTAPPGNHELLQFLSPIRLSHPSSARKAVGSQSSAFSFRNCWV